MSMTVIPIQAPMRHAFMRDLLPQFPLYHGEWSTLQCNAGLGTNIFEYPNFVMGSDRFYEGRHADANSEPVMDPPGPA